MLENFDKDYLKQIFLRVAAFAGGILLAVYIGYQIWHSVASFVETEAAEPFTVTEKSGGEGYIFREETVIPAAAGSLVPSVTAGEKVQVGYAVAGVYSSSGADVEARLADIDRQTALWSASLGDGELTRRDVSKLDSETYSVVTNMKKNVAAGDYSGAIAQRSSLISKINKRSVASGEVTDIQQKINSLRDEKSMLIQRLGQLRETVYSPAAGWYYPESDGYESDFSSAKIKDLTYDGFKQLTASPASGSSVSGGKIVTNCKWYFVCEVPESEFADKKVGEEYTLYFTNNQGAKLTMGLEKICESDDGKNAVLVYSSEKVPSGFSFVRRQKYEIVENEYKGLRVPKAAVRIVDGQAGVYVLTGEVVHFRKIDVLTEYEGGYIVAMEHGENKTPEDGEQTGDTSSPAETAPPSDTSSDNKKEGKDSYWLGLNENIIISGKGLREGRIITNPN